PIPASSAAVNVSPRRARSWSDALEFHRFVPTPSIGTLISDRPSGRSVPDSLIGRQVMRSRPAAAPPWTSSAANGEVSANRDGGIGVIQGVGGLLAEPLQKDRVRSLER